MASEELKDEIRSLIAEALKTSETWSMGEFEKLKTRTDKTEGVMEQILGRMQSIEQGAPKKFETNMTERRAFGILKQYLGKSQDFEDWKFQMMQFFSEEKDFS